LWLLLLAAAIVAALMLQSMTSARAVSADRHQWIQRYQLESAVETAMADIVINGPNSAFANAGHRATYILGGSQVEVRASSEGERVDLNDADPVQIDAALQRLAIAPDTRATILAQISAHRAASERWNSMAQVRNLLPPDTAPLQRQQLMDALTLSTGMVAPTPSDDNLRLDQPIRLEARMKDADTQGRTPATLTQIIRATTSAAGSVSILDRWEGGIP
jgi:hypothetical protein